MKLLFDEFGCPVAPTICQFGISEAGAAIAAGFLTSAGVGATTAGLAGTALVGATEGAAIGAGTSAATGGNIAQGAEFGGLTGGFLPLGSSALTSVAPGVASALGPVGTDVAVGAAGGTAAGAITGQPLATSALEGGVAGGLQGAMAPGTNVTQGAPTGGAVGSAAASAAPAGAPASAATGGDVTLNAAPTGGESLTQQETGTPAPTITPPAIPGGTDTGGVAAAVPSGAAPTAVPSPPASTTAPSVTPPSTSPAGAAPPSTTQPGFFDSIGNSISTAWNGSPAPAAGTPSLPGGTGPVTTGTAAPITPVASGDTGTGVGAALPAASPAATTTAPTAAAAPPASSGGISGFLSKNPGLAISGPGLLYQAFKGLSPLPEQNILQAQANQERRQGETLESYAMSGTLPAGLQAGIDQATTAAQASIRSMYAQRGMSGSSAEAQDVASVSARAKAEGAQIALSLMQQGISEEGAANQLYLNLMSGQMQQDQELSNAFAGFATSLVGQAGAPQQPKAA